MTKFIYKITYFSSLMAFGFLAYIGLDSLLGNQTNFFDMAILSGCFAGAFCYGTDFGGKLSSLTP
jgi:hypothetical protein